MRILVVDDDTHQLRSIKRYLNASGLSVITCENTEEAILALKGISFDTVLSDIQMPNDSGFTLIKWMGENMPDVPIFAMTAFGSDEIYRDVIQQGAVVYLEKPVDLKLLVQLLATSQDNCRGTSNFVTACLEASSSKGSGEVIVHNNKQLGQIFFHQGKIAWAAIQNNTVTFIDILQSECGIDKKLIATIIKQCKEQNNDIFSELISQEIVKKHELQRVIQRYVSNCFTQCLEWEMPKAMFIQSSRVFTGQILFDLVDILTLSNTTKYSPTLGN